MRFGPVALDDAEGAILAHAVSAGGQTWRKASLLSRDDILAMKAAGLTGVIAAVLEPGDMDENDAATRIARMFDGDFVDVRPAATGRVNIHARTAGVLTVDRRVVDAVNAVDPAITLATLPEFATVAEGQMIATVKIIPFAVAGELVEKAASIAGQADALVLRPFRPRRVGLIQTRLPSVKPSVLDKTARLLAERLARSGSMVTGELRVAHDEGALTEALAQTASQNDIVVVFGASAVSDGRDVIPAAIGKAGGVVERVGMPVDPGNLLVMGSFGETTVIGAPGCARSPKLNGFDWVLDRLMAGIAVGDGAIAGMGVGGLLMEIESRPQPREPRARRPVIVDAVLLCAGRGQRMGGSNKLLARFDGQPLVRRVADALAHSKVRRTAAVVGHQAELVADALEGADVRIVRNPAYASGLASSLKAGISTLGNDASGALIALGDMPGVTAAAVDRLVDAFVSAGGTSIVRATHAGKRGNPVILPRTLFEAVARLEGDTGARHLVETSQLPVIDIEIGEAASLDVDTPEAMARAGGILVD